MHFIFTWCSIRYFSKLEILNFQILHLSISLTILEIWKKECFWLMCCLPVQSVVKEHILLFFQQFSTIWPKAPRQSKCPTVKVLVENNHCQPSGVIFFVWIDHGNHCPKIYVTEKKADPPGLESWSMHPNIIVICHVLLVSSVNHDDKWRWWPRMRVSDRTWSNTCREQVLFGLPCMPKSKWPVWTPSRAGRRTSSCSPVSG